MKGGSLLPQPDWAEWIVESYLREVGEHLCDASELMGLDAVVLCHETSVDPQFVYANQAAQELWGRSWDEFIGMPSRLTTDEDHRAERASALSSPGVVRGYSGMRVTAHGERFWIRGATVWPVQRYSSNVREHLLVGQAATFSSWDFTAACD